MIALFMQQDAYSSCYDLVVVFHLLCLLLVCATAPSKICPSVVFLLGTAVPVHVMFWMLYLLVLVFVFWFCLNMVLLVNQR